MAANNAQPAPQSADLNTDIIPPLSLSIPQGCLWWHIQTYQRPSFDQTRDVIATAKSEHHLQFGSPSMIRQTKCLRELRAPSPLQTFIKAAAQALPGDSA
jgi:hypothetical protein